jgi:hypothetical protein
VFTSAGLYGTEAFQPGIVVLSLVIIVWMLVSLARIFVILRNMNADLTTADRWLVQVPFYGYFAWVNVATVANATTTLISLGWAGTQNGALWSAVIILTATLITAALVLYSRRSPGTIAFVAVLVWAFVGVYMGNNAQSGLVGGAAVAAVVVLVGVAIFRFFSDGGQSSQARPAAA